MTARKSKTERTETTEASSRRRFLKATGAIGAATVGVSGTLGAFSTDVAAQESPIQFAGRRGGWRGVAPESIRGRTNPTLSLERGTTYTVVWVNRDGLPHTFSIEDAEGNRLEVLKPIDASEVDVGGMNQTVTRVEETTAMTNETTTAEGTTTAEETATNETTAATETPTAEGRVTTLAGELVDVSQELTEEGAVQAVQFVATVEMSRYRCTVHPGTMVGNITVESGGP
ncbi:twin-arginine translocation signal domain-containing protein [Halorussus halophilus]|uniref:twin-arginine translocation signal domain-containing protein n=1 Tax=Halorussus halophilus TaxID=2650975 RepID=UPI0013016A76|nr:twin-arginine translocation signal domain-containing protein [Halorussus halophilus]